MNWDRIYLRAYSNGIWIICSNRDSSVGSTFTGSPHDSTGNSASGKEAEKNSNSHGRNNNRGHFFTRRKVLKCLQ